MGDISLECTSWKRIFQSKTLPQATEHQICNASSDGVFDPRGSRQMDTLTRPFGSLPAGINRTTSAYDFTAKIIPSVLGPQWLDTVHPASVTRISEKMPRLLIRSAASSNTSSEQAA